MNFQLCISNNNYISVMLVSWLLFILRPFHYNCTLAFSPNILSNHQKMYQVPTALYAQQYHPSQASQKRRSNFNSNTARESAVTVEWEPVSNLERRIEEGMNYHHDDFAFQENIRQSRRTKNKVNIGRRSSTTSTVEDAGEFVHRAFGVFVGYRVTQEERDRMKSAHPMD